MMSDVENYLEEIIGALDFSSINNFLYGHIPTEMTFEDLVAQISLYGLEALNRENITALILDSLFYELSQTRPLFLKMLVFSLLFSVAHRLLITKNKYISDMGFFVIYSILVTLLLQSFIMVRDIALAGIDTLIAFLNTLIPTYALTLVFSGNGISGAFVYEIAFVLVYLLELMMKSFLSPLIQVFLLVLFLNHLFEEDRLSKLASFMETGIQLILKVSFGAVMGLGVIQSLLTPAKDKLASQVALSGLSSIPEIGNLAGSAGELLLSCGLLIKNSVGVLGLIILFLLAVIPVVKIGCFWIMYHLLAIVLQPVADSRITECVSAVAKGCDLYLKIIVYSMMLFFVLFSIVSAATSMIVP